MPILLVLTLTCNHHQFGVDLSRSYSKCFIVVAAICPPLHWRDHTVPSALIHCLDDLP